MLDYLPKNVTDIVMAVRYVREIVECLGNLSNAQNVTSEYIFLLFSDIQAFCAITNEKTGEKKLLLLLPRDQACVFQSSSRLEY